MGVRGASDATKWNGGERLSREALEGAMRERLRRGGRFGAGLWTSTVDGREVVVKDVRTSNPVYRWLFGRAFLWHEANMYGYVRDCAFVPRFMGWIDSDGWAVERIAATNLGKVKPPLLSPSLYKELQRCVDELHSIGVVHLDLRSRRNILITPEGRMFIIDFGSALFIGRSWLSRRILVPLMGSVDNSAILKFRARDFPETLRPSEVWRCRIYRVRHILWPFGFIWRALGFNHGRKRSTARSNADSRTRAIASRAS